MKLKHCTFAAGLVLLLTGFVFVVGWLLQNPLVLPLGDNPSPTAPNSSLAFTLSGLILLLLARPDPAWRLLARGVTIALGALCLARLLELLLDARWGVDEFIIPYSASLPAFARTQMVSVSAANFLLISLGFVFLLWRGRIWAGDVLACALAIVVAVVGLVFVIGTVAGEPVLFAFDTVSMAATTALLFVVLGAGLLCAGLSGDYAHTREPFLRDTRIPTEKKISAAAGGAFGVVVLMGLLSYNNTVKFIEASRWVEQTQRTLVVLEALLANLTEAESCERGYVLTGQDHFVEPFRHATQQVTQRLGQALRLTESNLPAERVRVLALDPLVRARIALLAQVVDLRRQGRTAEAEEIVARGEGRLQMDRIRAEAAALAATARAQLAERASTREASRARTLFTFAAASIVVALILSGVHLILTHDLSGRRRAEAALRRHNDTLRSFAHTVAHDLRAPLRGIGGYAQELARDHGAALGERGRFCANRITAAAGQLEELIQDTLDFARLDAEALTLHTVNLPELVATLVHQREPQIRTHRTEISTQFGFDRALSWPRGLEQIIANLLDNALKYSRQSTPPRVFIQTTAAGDHWLLTVRDNGIGFDMKHHDRIFGLFQRLAPAAGFEGTGAGLAIAKKIAERLGGTLRAESAPGAGATFILRLPVSTPEADL